MRTTILLCIAALAMLWTPLSQGQPPLAMQQVAPGIYVHFGVPEIPDTRNHGAIANVGFIVGEKCVAVMDSGGNPSQGRALRAAIVQTTDVPVCYVINTHVHPDHIYGNKAFKAPGVRFIGHRNLPRAMAERGKYYVEKAGEQLDIEMSEEDLVFPDILVEGKHFLNLGNRVLVLTAHGPAHTDNDLSVFDPATETLWLSDLLFLEHLPVIDGSLNGWLEELAELEKVAAARAIPGHGPLVTDWPEGLAPERLYLEMLRREIRAMIKAGRFLEEAVSSVGLSARGQWALFDDFHRKNVTTAFAELEWEDE